MKEKRKKGRSEGKGEGKGEVYSLVVSSVAVISVIALSLIRHDPSLKHVAAPQDLLGTSSRARDKFLHRIFGFVAQNLGKLSTIAIRVGLLHDNTASYSLETSPEPSEL